LSFDEMTTRGAYSTPILPADPDSLLTTQGLKTFPDTSVSIEVSVEKGREGYRIPKIPSNTPTSLQIQG